MDILFKNARNKAKYSIILKIVQMHYEVENKATSSLAFPAHITIIVLKDIVKTWGLAVIRFCSPFALNYKIIYITYRNIKLNILKIKVEFIIS